MLNANPYPSRHGLQSNNSHRRLSLWQLTYPEGLHAGMRASSDTCRLAHDIHLLGRCTAPPPPPPTGGLPSPLDPVLPPARPASTKLVRHPTNRSTTRYTREHVASPGMRPMRRGDAPPPPPPQGFF